MGKNTYLKRKNVPILVLFIVWCLAVYVTFQASPTGFWDKIHVTFGELRADDAIPIVMSPVLVLVLNGFLSAAMKARLVFWRWKHALPGHRAFSRLASRDPRIDMAVLEDKLNNIPRDPEGQNTLWYSLYRKQESKMIVREAHRQFLLARDSGSIAFLFSIFGTLGLWYFDHTLSWLLTYFVVMIVHYIVLAIVARNHGNGFVCNVLIEVLQD